MNKDKHLGMKIDPESHYKLHYIAEYEGRSGNKQVLYLIRQYIKQFELQNGVIEMPKETEEK